MYWPTQTAVAVKKPKPCNPNNPIYSKHSVHQSG